MDEGDLGCEDAGKPTWVGEDNLARVGEDKLAWVGKEIVEDNIFWFGDGKLAWAGDDGPLRTGETDW